MLSVENINYVFVLVEGILSFFSPCVLPLIPIYLSYLAGNGKQINEKGEVIYKRKIVLWNTVLFVLGISFAFFILGMSFSTLGNFFKNYKEIMIKVAGIFIILLGIFQLGVFNIKFLNQEHKWQAKINRERMNPILAFILGFTFSFAWTPCVGPALASVLMLASSSASIGKGNALVLLYTLGFIIPFIVLGLFTTRALNFLKQKKKAFQYTIKISAILLILMGVLTTMGWMNGISSYVTGIGTNKEVRKEENQEVSKEQENIKEQKQEQKDALSTAYPFSLQDQNGKTHTLQEYRGKVVFLNFWATWCPPCKKEMPFIEQLYQEYGKNTGDVIILGVANPKTKQNHYAQDVSKEEIIQFLKDKKITFPVGMDETGEVLEQYGINAFPTTFMIDKQGNISEYYMGAMDKKTMKDSIEQALKKSE